MIILGQSPDQDDGPLIVHAAFISISNATIALKLLVAFSAA